jgi:hypothetical protein
MTGGRDPCDRGAYSGLPSVRVFAGHTESPDEQQLARDQ